MAKANEQSLTGKVVKRRVGGKSKHAHVGVVLESDAGRFLLRREGAENPFNDPELEALVGLTLRFRGEVDGTTFFVTSWDCHPERSEGSSRS